MSGGALSAAMRIYRHFEGLHPEHLGAAIAIGNFDGVHLGHQEVINIAGGVAKENGTAWGVLTFEPHPRMFFAKDTPPFRLSPFHIKARHIEAMGVDFLVVLHFDEDLSRMTAEDFVSDVLSEGFKASHIVSGFDFVFGYQRQGSSQFLEEIGAKMNFATSSVKPINDPGGEIISSTRIRTYLADGKPPEAARLLGRNYEIEGRVVHGEERGRTIGFATANVELDTNTLPALGVYAVQTGIDQGTDTVWHDGVANLGYRPTFDGKTPILETHLFDFDEDIYGKHLRVALVEYLRPEQKFSGVDDLKNQIEKDCIRAQKLLSERN